MAQWAKSPKKQSVGVLFWQFCPLGRSFLKISARGSDDQKKKIHGFEKEILTSFFFSISPMLVLMIFFGHVKEVQKLTPFECLFC